MVLGCKTIEKSINYGFLNERIIKKHIQNAEYYQKYQLFLVTSPLMEKHFMEQCGIKEDKLIRADYPAAYTQKKFQLIIIIFWN